VSNKPTATPTGEKPASVIQPIIDDLKGTTITNPPQEDEAAPPRGPVHPPQPAELDQDSGGGYNSNRTYPQT
jgi:hypothetical protein